MRTHERLKTKHRALRDSAGRPVSVRIHRALSWLDRAERESDDPDAAFIFYWIAFNAAYATDEQIFGEKKDERGSFDSYFEKILRCDLRRQIHYAILNRFKLSIGQLLDNHFVFQPFWSHYNGLPNYGNWAAKFDEMNAKARKALDTSNTRRILCILFDRLYVLRNQLLHGGATWNSDKNRKQVQDGERILAFLIPLFIELMMDNPAERWGELRVPVVD